MRKNLERIYKEASYLKRETPEAYYQRAVQENADLGGTVEEIRQQVTAYFGEDVLITDPAEIARRKAFSDNARTKVVMDTVQVGSLYTVPHKDSWRPYGLLYNRDTSSPDYVTDNIEFEKYAGQKPSAEKGQYMFRRLHSMMNRCDADRIRQIKDMSDAELVANARDIIYANTLAGELATLTQGKAGNPYQFSDWQLKQLTEYGNLFGAELGEIMFRLEAIVNPCYPYVSQQKMMALSDDTLATMHSDEEVSQALLDMVSGITLTRYGMLERQIATLENQLKAEGLDIRARGVEFTDSENTSTKDGYDAVRDAMFNAMKNGRMMRLDFPNGERRVLSADSMEKGYQLRPALAVNFQLTRNARILKDMVEEADPLLLISSKEYKNMKLAVMDVQNIKELTEPLDLKQIEENRKLLTQLKETSAEYLRVKGEQRGVTDGRINSTRRREIPRIAAAEGVKNYAEIKLQQLEEAEKQLAKSAEKDRPKAKTSKPPVARDASEASMEQVRQYKERTARLLNDPNLSDGMKGLAEGVNESVDKLENFCQGKINMNKPEIYRAVVSLVLFEAVEKSRAVQDAGAKNPLEELLERPNGYARTLKDFQNHPNTVNFMSNFKLKGPEDVQKFLENKSARTFPNGGKVQQIEQGGAAPQRQLQNDAPKKNEPSKGRGGL